MRPGRAFCGCVRADRRRGARHRGRRVRRARGVLAALGEPDDELTATPAMRHRLEGAALALESLAGSDRGQSS